MFTRAAGLIVLLLLCPLAAFAQYTADAVKGRELLLRETANDNRKVYVQVGDTTAYYIHDFSRLFPVRKAEAVTVMGVSQKKNAQEVTFASKNLGKGKIRVFGATTPELFDAVMRSAFAEAGSTNSPPGYIANKTSRYVHFAGSNHLPEPGERVAATAAEIESGHYIKCPLCFHRMPRVSNADMEMRLGQMTAGQVHLTHPLVTDDKVQGRVREVGRRVLSRWVMPLKGYDYRFYVVDSEETNAFACAGGKIYVTTALLDAVESDEELEGILAHEVAHVELRHGYRQFRSAQKAAFWGGLAAVALGAYNQAAFDLANVFSQIAAGIVMSGHQRRYESEADALAYLYFETNRLGSGRLSFRNVLRKLQYNQDYYQPDKETPSLLATHPEIDERIDAVEKSEMRVFSSDDVFYGYDKEGALVATLNFQAQRAYTGTLNNDDVGLQVIALVETTSALGDRDRIKDIRLTTKSGSVLMDNKEDTEVLPNDSVGASFVNKTQRTPVEEITGIDLKLKNVVRWERKQTAGL